jgi:AcrR family transcriptional regulator
MSRGSRGQAAELTVVDDARERILAATERCVERYGLRKTTIDDVACEVGLSRPSIYRYFVDRDDLLIELITRHARALINRTHRAMSRQSSLSDQIIESILYIGELARRDSLTRHVLDPDNTNLGRRMIASGRSETIRAELFDRYLDAASRIMNCRWAFRDRTRTCGWVTSSRWLCAVSTTVKATSSATGPSCGASSPRPLSAQTRKPAPERRHAVGRET